MAGCGSVRQCEFSVLSRGVFLCIILFSGFWEVKKMNNNTKELFVKEIDKNVVVFSHDVLLAQVEYLYEAPKNALDVVKAATRNNENEIVIDTFDNKKICNSLTDFSSTMGVVARFNFIDRLLCVLSAKFAPKYTSGAIRYFGDDFEKYNRMKGYVADYALNEYLNCLQIVFYEMDLLTFFNLYAKSREAICTLSSDTVALIETLDCFELDNFDKIDKVRMVEMVSEIGDRNNGLLKSYNALTEHKYKMYEYSLEMERLLLHITKSVCSIRSYKNKNDTSAVLLNEAFKRLGHNLFVKTVYAER
jgi:hypothetical protein